MTPTLMIVKVVFFYDQANDYYNDDDVSYEEVCSHFSERNISAISLIVRDFID